MFLLGIYFKWNKFLWIKKETAELRLQFTARDEDKVYLESKIRETECLYKNDKMENGLMYISAYMKKNIGGTDEKDFGNYIFNHLTFFLSELPYKYSSRELNTYFERMNTSGKSLENYEILKVEVIQRITSNKENYTRLWNACSIMEKMILRIHSNEKQSGLRERYKNAILDILDGGNIDNAFEKLNTKFVDDEDADDGEQDSGTENPTIGSIPANPENPYKRVKRRTDEHSLLTFPEFLLQVLYLCLNQDLGDPKEMHTTDFFDVRKLCETFKWAFKRGLKAEVFMQKLGLYRLLNDYFIIRMNDEDEEPYPFLLYKGDGSEDGEEGDENSKKEKMKVRMFQAMLYSASSAMTYYMWMPKVLSFLEKHVREFRNLGLKASKYLKKLKEIDNEWHPFPDKNTLNYSTIDRYWFWRIDYYLWEYRDLFFERDLFKVVEKYVFRRNRSIEHIAPQNPKDEFGDKKRFNWQSETNSDLVKLRDCLGNMVMISSGQNSSLSNSCFEVKRAVMSRYASGVGGGSVESLKMLYVYTKYAEWSLDNIRAHERFSLAIIKDSYLDDSDEWESNTMV